MREFVIQVGHVKSFDDFIAAFNEGFCRFVGGEWNGNWNAFNDYLSWPEEERYRLVLQGWAGCSAELERSTRNMILEIIHDNDHVELVL